MTDEMDFANEMLSEAVDYNLENTADLDADEDLVSLEIDLQKALTEGDIKTAFVLAAEVRRYLIANGYAEDSELTATPEENR